MSSLSKEMCLLNCLAAAQNLSFYLVCNHLSNGELFESELKQSVDQFLLQFYNFDQHYPGMFVPLVVRNSAICEYKSASEMFITIGMFDVGTDFYSIFSNSGMFGFIINSLHNIANVCMKELGSEVSFTTIDAMQLEQYKKKHVRWDAHFPYIFLFVTDDIDNYLHKISDTSTIVVVGDIRKSQDLMTYAENPNSYSDSLVEFMTKTRQLVFENYGIFDKFTGDGFVAYFNEDMCKNNGSDYVSCFLKFVQDEQEYAQVTLFPKWIEGIRKHPSKSIGLSIGADVGKVQFRDINQHFVAFGDSIVWATRMSAAGNAGEVIVNNLLYHTLKNNRSLTFTKRSAQTKSGENFLARRVEMMRHNPRPKRPHQ